MSLAEIAKQVPIRSFSCAVRNLRESLPESEQAALDELAAQVIQGRRSWTNMQNLVRADLGRGPGYAVYKNHYRDRSCACARTSESRR